MVGGGEKGEKEEEAEEEEEAEGRRLARGKENQPNGRKTLSAVPSLSTHHGSKLFCKVVLKNCIIATTLETKSY